MSLPDPDEVSRLAELLDQELPQLPPRSASLKGVPLDNEAAVAQVIADEFRDWLEANTSVLRARPSLAAGEIVRMVGLILRKHGAH